MTVKARVSGVSTLCSVCTLCSLGSGGGQEGVRRGSGGWSSRHKQIHNAQTNCSVLRARTDKGRGGWTLNYAGTLHFQAPHVPLYRCTQGLWGGAT
eukprot:1128952-Prorocentrum_minimum.AAC.1